MRRHPSCLVLILVLLVAAACSRPAPAADPIPSPQRLGNEASAMSFSPVTIAKLMEPTVAVSEPWNRDVVAHLSTSIRPGGGPTELLVLDRWRGDGREWLRVRLPDRPNDAAGWIESGVAVLRTTPWRIVVSTERRTVEVFRLDEWVRTFRAVVGAPASPTPHGRFAIAERIHLADPNGFYGSWILTLTAHSTVYEHFDGGDGRAAIHGRGGASLLDPLGTARSHGCVRLDNRAVDWLARIARPGTPVRIT